MKVPKTKLPVLNPDDIVVDNTILSDITCSTRGAMRHVLGYTTKAEAVELVSGSAVHEGLARWLVTGGDGKAALAQFDGAYREWARKHVPLVDEKGKPSRLAWQPVHRILEHWLENHSYREWGFTVDPAHVEVPVWAWMGHLEGGKVRWTDPLRGPGNVRHRILFIALLDAIGQKKVGKGWWSIDHKSTGNVGQWWRERQEDAAQFTGQLWAAQARGISGLNGVYINGLELPNLHTSKKKCYTHGTTYALCALSHVGTSLFPVTRSRPEMEGWVLTARQLTRRYIRLRENVRDVKDVQEVPMEGRFMGHCGRCTFRQWCRGGRQVHQAEKSFIVKRWDPIEHARRKGGVAA